MENGRAMNWWNLCLLLVLSAGHAELWVALINRLHAFPIAHGGLRHIRHVHDAALLLFPAALLWFVGLHGPRLLTYGRWSDLSPAWSVVLVSCAVGVVSLVVSAARHQWAPPPAAVLAERSEVVDIARELGVSPIAEGPYLWMAKLPGNEQFTVELTEKRIALPRLPAAWNGLRIVQLSDWHLMPTLDRSYFEAVTEQVLAKPADLIVFTGDLVDDLRCLDWLPETIGRFDARLGRYFILGNHDRELDEGAVRRAMDDLGWRDVAGRTFTIELEGHRLVMGGDETPWLGCVPDFSGSLPDDFRLLLSHTPDHFTRAQRTNIDLMLAGHNHGGQVVLPVIGPVYAPSRYGVRYTDGTFFRSPTLMHVSRGLSGCHPYRWRCRPEVTWLVLEQEST